MAADINWGAVVGLLFAALLFTQAVKSLVSGKLSSRFGLIERKKSPGVYFLTIGLEVALGVFFLLLAFGPQSGFRL